MNDHDSITEAQLNAFVDGMLHEDERAQVHKAISEDSDLARTVAEYRQDMDLISLAYGKTPIPKASKAALFSNKFPQKRMLAAASVFFAVLGLFAGWMVSSWQHKHDIPAFTSTKEFSPVNFKREKILIHVSSVDDARVLSALGKAEEILKHSEISGKSVQLEVVANADGLNILRNGSPYAAKIRTLSNQYANVDFLACGIAMENFRLKEGNEPQLIPEATKIPAALTEILQKLKEGWLYVRA